MATIGVLSDTHGTLHPCLIPIFHEAQVEAILHAGDVGKMSILEELRALAPVHAVRGNVDTEGAVAELPRYVQLALGGTDIYMTHVGGKPSEWLPRLSEPLPRVAICGHSHIALLEELSGVFFLNPGAAGTRRRFRRPFTAALLRVEGASVRAEILTLEE